MSFLTQNITSIKLIKRNIDSWGSQWVKNLDTSRGLVLSHDVCTNPRNANVAYFSLNLNIARWKSAVVELDKDTFCLGLDLHKSFDLSIEDVLNFNEVMYTYKNGSVISIDLYNRIFNVTNAEELESRIKELLAKKKELEGSLKGVVYNFKLLKDDKSFSTNLFSKKLDFNNMLYFPLLTIKTITNLESSTTRYSVGFLMNNAYNHIFYQSSESLLEALSGDALRTLLFGGRPDPILGLNHLQYKIKGKEYSMTL